MIINEILQALTPANNLELIDPNASAFQVLTVDDETFEDMIPENPRFISGQEIYLYVPRANTTRRYGLAKFSADDFSVSSTGVLTLLLSKSQQEQYFSEILGGTREETVLADPAINLLNLHLTDEDLYDKIDDLYDRDSEIYGSLGR